jgi:hypothetical protein
MEVRVRAKQWSPDEVVLAYIEAWNTPDVREHEETCWTGAGRTRAHIPIPYPRYGARKRLWPISGGS